ncbi:hypothetical protein D3C79_874480 [compost metagenome]
MDGPAAWATLLARLNSAMPMAILLAGSSVMISWNESGMSTAPAAPCITLRVIIASRLGAHEQAIDASRKMNEPVHITRRMENTSTSQAVSGIMTISATR